MVRLTRRQKEEVKRAGEDPNGWALIEATQDGNLYGMKKDVCRLMFIGPGGVKKIRIEAKYKHKNGIEKLLRGAGETLLGFAVAAVFIYMLFFAPDPGNAYTPEPQYIQAIGSDYMIPAEDYDDYLQERQAYLDAEKEELRWMDEMLSNASQP